MSKPFVYIAALRRTGSTMLSEALTLPPHSYVFREPGLPLGRFRVKDNDIGFFGDHGIDLPAFRDELVRLPRKRGVALFVEKILPRLLTVVGQVGVKEIHHEGWDDVLDAVPDSKVILTARDPRDIYISLHDKHVDPARTLSWDGPFTPESVARALLADFRAQLALAERASCVKVRYEDLCLDGAVLEEVKRFVESEVPGSGVVGGLSRADHNRSKHGRAISTVMVGRWRTVSDPTISGEAQRTYELMRDYCDYWGY